MIEFKHILCPVDFSDASKPSLAAAAALARWYGARLTLIHVVPTFDAMPVYGNSGEAFQLVQPMSREEVVSEIRRQMDVGAVAPDAAVVARAGDTSAVIVHEAATSGADLIVMGTHGRRGFRRLLLGSVTESVLHHAQCPVLTVPPRADAPVTGPVTFKRILCAMDFSPAAQEALDVALNLGRQADGAVTVLHAIEWLTEEDPKSTAHFDVPEFRRHMAADSQRQLEALTEGESRTWCEIHHVVVFGRAHRQILEAATNDATELIVMGAQGRGGVGLALFGSTTHEVVRGAACPVLTVRAPQP